MLAEKINDIIFELVEPIVTSFGCDLIDVEYIKESGDWYLRIFIDKVGGIFINDCELVSKEISALLDKDDPIEEAYFLEVCSPGLDRELKKEREFAKFIGRDIDIKLYKPIVNEDGSKTKKFTAILKSYDEKGIITVQIKDEIVEFNRKDVAKVNLHFDFNINNQL